MLTLKKKFLLILNLTAFYITFISFSKSSKLFSIKIATCIIFISMFHWSIEYKTILNVITAIIDMYSFVTKTTDSE